VRRRVKSNEIKNRNLGTEILWDIFHWKQEDNFSEKGLIGGWRSVIGRMMNGKWWMGGE
jgi:hypothetical protein